MTKCGKKARLPEDIACRNCIHRTGKETCKAFPNGIPEDYHWGIDVHLQKDDDQVGDFLLEETEEYLARRERIRAEAERE
jgi:hypothetical protein